MANGKIYSLLATHHSPRSHRDRTACFVSLSFAGLVVLARSLNPIPSRTRPLNSSAPMVLWLKPWESRSLPGLQSTSPQSPHDVVQSKHKRRPGLKPGRRSCVWGSRCNIAPAADGSIVSADRHFVIMTRWSCGLLGVVSVCSPR